MPPTITYTDERDRLTVEALEALGVAERAVSRLRTLLIRDEVGAPATSLVNGLPAKIADAMIAVHASAMLDLDPEAGEA